MVTAITLIRISMTTRTMKETSEAIMQVFIKILLSVLTKIAMAACGEKVVVWLVFKAAEELAQSTKSDVDDEFVAMVKQSFEDSKQRANNK